MNTNWAKHQSLSFAETDIYSAQNEGIEVMPAKKSDYLATEFSTSSKIPTTWTIKSKELIGSASKPSEENPYVKGPIAAGTGSESSTWIQKEEKKKTG